MEALSSIKLGELIPAAYTNTKGPRLSDDFLVIPTIDVINILEGLGFSIDSGFQRKPQQGSTNNPYEVHIVRMINTRLSVTINDVTFIPGITLINAQNAKYQMTGTAFIKIAHNGNTAYLEAPSIMSYTFRKVKPHPLTIEAVNEMLSLFMNPKTLYKFNVLCNKMALTDIDEVSFFQTVMPLRDADKYHTNPHGIKVPAEVTNMAEFYLFAYNIILSGEYYRTDSTSGKLRKSQPLKDGMKEYELLSKIYHYIFL